MKKQVLLLTALAICVLMIPLMAEADQSGTCGTIDWTLNTATGTMTLSGSGDVDMDYSVDVPRDLVTKIIINYGPTRILNLSNFHKMVSVSIPSSVTALGDESDDGRRSTGAFSNCEKLQSVTLPDSVTIVGACSFQSCSSLQNITLSKGLTRISESAFYSCSRLKSITIPDSVTEIGEDAFSFCSSLQKVTLPKGLTRISESMFYECSQLKSITIPDSVTEIEADAFSSSGLTSIVIPDGVTTLGQYAFGYCSYLNEITLPASVTSIDEKTFYGSGSCRRLPVFWVVRGSYAHQYVKNTDFWTRVFCKIIGKDPPLINLSDCTFEPVKNRIYNGKQQLPSVKVTYKGKTLTEFVDYDHRSDYTISWENNVKVGKATITIIGWDRYIGTRTITFKILPKGTTLRTLTAGKKRFTATWKKQSVQTTGYQLQYALKKNFKGAKLLTIPKRATLKMPVMKLKARTNYYVRIRTYKTVGKTNYCSAWSKVRRIRTR